MEAVKRVEIVIDSVETSRLVKILEAAGVSGYTIIRDVSGSGGRGERTGDQLADVLKNNLVLTTCPAAALDGLVARLRPILKRAGGICLVSDAFEIRH